MAEYYAASFDSWTARLPSLLAQPSSSLASSSKALTDTIDLEISRLAFKILGRLAVYGWTDRDANAKPKVRI